MQEVLIDYMISNSVKMNHITTTLRVYDDGDGSLPSRMGREVISYGLSVVRISYICLGLAVSLVQNGRPRCDSTLGLAVGILILGVSYGIGSELA